MLVFAFDHNNCLVSLVDARDKELAKAYWQGLGVDTHRVRTLKELKAEKGYSLEDENVGVVPLMKTKKVKPGGIFSQLEPDIIVLPA